MGFKIDSQDVLDILNAAKAQYMRQAYQYKQKMDLGVFDKRTCSSQWLKESELIAEMNALAIKQVTDRVMGLTDDNNHSN